MRCQVTFRQAMEGPLVLVNDRHPLAVWPAHDALTPALPGAPGVLLRRPAAERLAALLGDIGAAGRIAAVSGWRAHAEQQALYDDSVRENGLDFTKTYVALPGCSEHETGLAIDVGEMRDEIDFLRPAFPDAGVCRAFRLAAPRYGFILRYPENARPITHIGGEPWHFRYVGAPHAQRIAAGGCTLEEYIASLRAYTPARPLELCADGRDYRVFSVPLSADGAAFDVPEGCAWQASADNCGGLIVTLLGSTEPITAHASTANCSVTLHKNTRLYTKYSLRFLSCLTENLRAAARTPIDSALPWGAS